jgi:uncharacterized membrane protein YoaT (DUF817 family)
MKHASFQYISFICLKIFDIIKTDFYASLPHNSIAAGLILLKALLETAKIATIASMAHIYGCSQDIFRERGTAGTFSYKLTSKPLNTPFMLKISFNFNNSSW